MYCKAGVACTNPEVYGDIKRGRRLAPSKGIVCPRCQGKCCNEACLEKHKCKQRARSSSSVGMGRAGVQHGRWQDPTGLFGDPASFLDPNMQLALARAGQGGLLLPQGGNMMPVIPILPLPLMFNTAALQQAGAEGGLDAAQLQAALAAAGAMGAGGAGMSAPMMLASLGGNQGAADAAGVSQALQLAQLQAAGLGGPLLQLTVQPDGMVQAGNGQRLALPPGLMQGMPLQLPGGALQFLSTEQLQLGADGAGGALPLMQVMPDGTTQLDQAAMNAAVAAAAAAGGLDGGLMAGLTAMGANLAGLAGVSGSDAQAFLEQQQQQLELNAAAAAAAAAAGEGLPAGMGGEAAAGAEDPAAAEAAAAAAAAGLPPGAYGADGDAGQGLEDPGSALAAAAAAAGQPADLQQLVQQQQQQQVVVVDSSAAAAGGAPNPDAPAPSADALPPGAALVGGDGSGLVLPGIAPLQMAPELAAALNAASGGRGLYNAEEDTAAAALMSLATDKKNKAAAAAAAAQAAALAANEGIIPQAMAAQALEQARQLQAEAEAEAEAEARAQQQQQQDPQAHQQQQQFGDAAAGAGEGQAVKLEFPGVSQEQLEQLQLQLLQQQQLQMLQQQQQQAQQAEQQQQQLEAQVQQEPGLDNQQHHFEQA